MTSETEYTPEKLPPSDEEVHLMSGPLQERARELGRARSTIWYWRRNPGLPTYGGAQTTATSEMNRSRSQTCFASVIRTVGMLAAATRTTAGAERAI